MRISQPLLVARLQLLMHSCGSRLNHKMWPNNGKGRVKLPWEGKGRGDGSLFGAGKGDGSLFDRHFSLMPACLPALQRLASLRSLSLWNTQVTEEGARRLTQAFEAPDRLQQWEQQVADLQHKILHHVPSIQFDPRAPE